MTAAQFAEKIGISPSSLSHILSGRNNPSLEVVMKIHKACDYISLDWLLYGEGQMKRMLIQTITFIIRLLCLMRIHYLRPNVQFLRNIARKMRLKHHFILLKRLCVRKLSMWKYLPKKITEIRIFFDNGTYETFKPEN